MFSIIFIFLIFLWHFLVEWEGKEEEILKLKSADVKNEANFFFLSDYVKGVILTIKKKKKKKKSLWNERE